MKRPPHSVWSLVVLTVSLAAGSTRTSAFVLPSRTRTVSLTLQSIRRKDDFSSPTCTNQPSNAPGNKTSLASHCTTWEKTTAATSSLLLAAILCFLPLPAHAGFGPSGAATTTPAPVSKVNVNELSQKKLQQLIDSSLDDDRLDDFQSQLDALIENISRSLGAQEPEKDQGRPGLQSTNGAGDQQRLESAKDFQEQIQKREKLLDMLEAQPWWFNYLAAFVGSVMSTCIMHPVDTIKTRLQAKSSADGEVDTEGVFTNVYEGLTGNILKEGPPFAFYLGVYESVKASLLHGALAPFWAGLWGVSASSAAAVSGGNPVYLLSIYLSSGAAGELVGSTARAPAEAVKNLVQTQAAGTTAEAFQLAVSTPESRLTLFRAWSASLLRDVPFGAIQLALFELIKAYILNNPDIDIDTSTLQAEAAIGTISGGIGAFVTNPSDVVTTRIITQPRGEGKAPLGAFEMGKLIFQEGGIGAFFNGSLARVLYWAPAISIFLTGYCSVRQLGVKLDLFG